MNQKLEGLLARLEVVLSEPPETDRVDQLTQRLNEVARSVGDHDRRLAALDNLHLMDRLAELEARVADFDGWLHSDRLLLMNLEERVAALEQPTASSSKPPKPPRFVPTEPGWYWRRDNDLRIVVRVIDDPNGRKALTWCWGAADTLPVVDDGLWLAPVAPYAPPTVTISNVRAYDDKGNDISDRVEAVEGGFRLKAPTRTEEEARAKPMRGDRWHWPSLGTYTLVAPENDGLWSGRYVEGGMPPLLVGGHMPGKPGDVFLGNFAHELDAEGA